MCRRVIPTCFMALIATLSAQAQSSSLAGTVSQPSGAVVAEAPIQVKNKITGKIARTTSNSDGRYTLAEVPESCEPIRFMRYYRSLWEQLAA